MFRYISKEKLTDKQKLRIFNRTQLILVVTCLKELAEYLLVNPDKLKIKRIPINDGKSYQKIVEVPIPPLEMEFVTEEEMKNE